MKNRKSWLDRFSVKKESGQTSLDRITAEILAEDAETPARKTSRRSFLARFGAGATVIALAGQAFAYLRSLKPNVLYEEPQRFKVGTPDQFGEGGRFLEDKRLFVFKERNTFYAIRQAALIWAAQSKWRN